LVEQLHFTLFFYRKPRSVRLRSTRFEWRIIFGKFKKQLKTTLGPFQGKRYFKTRK